MDIQVAATNPYVGPRAFRQGETLYGRDREKRDLLDLLVARRIVLLYSPSGAGKSSLINAGLIPALKEEGFRVLPVVRVNLDPRAALGVKSLDEVPIQGEHAFNPYIFSVLLSFEENLPKEERIPPDQLASMSLEEYLTRCPRAEGEPEDDVLIFDQFEEILTTNPTDREGKKAFFAEVGAALRSRSRWALFAMREDYMPALEPYLRPIPTRFANTFRLDFLGVEAARLAIQNPALDRQVKFITAAADKLIDDLRTVQVQQPDGKMEKEKGLYVEPVQLQVVCFRLWEKLPEGVQEISEADIVHLEGMAQSLVDQSLAGYYADCVAATAKELGAKGIAVSEREIREWFEYKLITEHSVRGQVLRGVEQSDGLKNDAILQLVGAHLVRAEKRAGATWFELAHDRLIHPVRDSNAAWMKKNLVQLQRQAMLWEREGRTDSLLLRGLELVEAQQWAETHGNEMRPVERRFLKLSRDAAEQEERARLEAERAYQQKLELESAQQVAEVERQRAEAERQRAEAERQQAEAERQRAVTANQLAETERQAAARLRQRAFYLAGALIAVLVLFAISSYLFVDANNQRTIAQNEKVIAERERLNAQQAQADAENSEILAVLQRATAQAAEVEERKQREIAFQQSQIATARQLAAQAYSLKGDQPDLALLLSLEGVGLLKEHSIGEISEPKASLLDVLTGSSLFASFYRDSDYVNGIAVSQDGRRLGSLRYDRIQIWDLEAGQLITETGMGMSVASWSLSPDGKAVAYSDYNTGVGVWNVEDNSNTSVLPQIQDYPPALAYSPDGRLLALAGRGLQLWQAGSGSIQQLSESDYQNVVAFNQDGSFLAAVSQDGAIELWNTATYERTGLPFERTDEALFVSSLAFSKDEQGQPLLVVVDGNGNLFAWDLNSLQKQIVNFQIPGFPFVLSADGTNLAYRSAERTLQVCRLDLSSASCPTLKAIKSPPGETGVLAFSPVGNLLAEGRTDGSILVWQMSGNVLTGAPLQASRVPVVGLAFRSSGAGLDLISGTADGERPLLIWDLSYPGMETALDVRVKPKIDFISSRLAFSPDGQTLISGDRDGGLRLWNTATFHLSGALYEHVSEIKSTAVSPDGKYLASVDKDGQLVLWDLEKRLPVPSFEGFIGVTSVAFSADSKWLAIGGRDGVVNLWEAPTGFLVRTLSPPNSQSPVASLGFSLRSMQLAVGYESAPTGAQAAVQSGGQADSLPENLVLWDLSSTVPIPFPLRAHKSTVSHVAFDWSGDQLASADLEGRVYLWNISEKRGKIFKGLSGYITGLAFSRFNDFLIAGLDSAVARCRLDALTCESVFTGGARFTSNPVLIPAGDLLAAGDGQGRIHFWDLYTEEETGSILSGEQEEISQEVSSLALAPDGRILASGGIEGSILRWDLEKGERVGETLNAHSKAVMGLAFSPDGQWLASSGLDGVVRIWDSDGQEVNHYSEAGKSVSALAFRPNSAQLVIQLNPLSMDGLGSPGFIPGPFADPGFYTQTSSSIILWDLSVSQSQPEPLDLPNGEGSIGWVTSMAFSPDGALLAFGRNDGLISLWDAAASKPLKPLPTGLEQAVQSLAFSPDGAWLATGSEDGTLILWDAGLDEWEQVSRLAGQSGARIALAFDPDGKILASGGPDGTILLWDVNPDQWAAKACKAAGRNLRWSEWDKYLNPSEDQPYPETCPDYTIPPDVITGQIERVKSRDSSPEEIQKILTDATRWSESVNDPQLLGRVCAFGTLQGLVADVAGVCGRLSEMLPDPASQAQLYADIGETALAKQLAEQIEDPYSRADIYYRIGETDQAIRTAEQIEDINSRAGFYLQIGQLERAKELAEQIQNPYERANFFYYQLGEVERAKELADQIESFYERAYFYYQIGDLAEAWLLAEGIENPYDRAYLYYLINENGLARQTAELVLNPYDRAYLYYQIGEADLANRAAEQIENLYDRGYLYTLTGETARAKQIADQIEDPFQRAFLYYQVGETELAEQAAENITSPRDRAYLYVNIGNYERAKQLAEQVEDPWDRASLYNDIGEIELAKQTAEQIQDPLRRAYFYNFLGEKDQARQLAEQVQDPLNRAYLYAEIGDQDQAKQSAGQVQDPLDRANLYHFIGEAGLAEQAFREALESDQARDEPDYNDQICRSGSLAGLAETIMPACELALRLAEDLNLSGANIIRYHDSRGLARALAGDTGGAIEDFQFVVQALKTDGAKYYAEETLDQFLSTRESYLSELEAGRNPFGEETLNYLRNEGL